MECRRERKFTKVQKIKIWVSDFPKNYFLEIYCVNYYNIVK